MIDEQSLRIKPVVGLGSSSGRRLEVEKRVVNLDRVVHAPCAKSSLSRSRHPDAWAAAMMSASQYDTCQAWLPVIAALTAERRSARRAGGSNQAMPSSTRLVAIQNGTSAADRRKTSSAHPEPSQASSASRVAPYSRSNCSSPVASSPDSSRLGLLRRRDQLLDGCRVHTGA